MVFFSCDGCNEVLKKNQVDAHANRCRRCHAVSCVDCNVSFPGDDYRAHTSCVTEAERYEKRPPPSSQKSSGKFSPQQQWMNVISSCVDKAPAHLQKYLTTMSDLDNVPRKEKQFRNFTINSLNLRGKGQNGEQIVSTIWNLLKAERDRQREISPATATGAPERQSSSQSSSNEPTVNQGSRKESISDSRSDNPVVEAPQVASSVEASSNERETQPTAPEIPRPKDVKKAIKSVLKKAKDHCLTEKELRKAIQKQFDLPKSDLKRLVKDAAASSRKSLSVQGKVIQLKISKDQ